MSSFVLFGVPGQVDHIIQLLEANGLQVDNLQLIDDTISSRAPAATALSTADWTAARASRLDYPVSASRPAILKSQKFTSSGNWAVPANIMGRMVYVTGSGGGASGNVDGSFPLGGGAGMSCVGMPITMDSGITSVPIGIGAGGAGTSGSSGQSGGATTFGKLLTLRGGGSDPGTPFNVGAKHLGLASSEYGFRSGFMICGADNGADCVDTGYASGGPDSGGASAFADGGVYPGGAGSLGSGGAGVTSGTSGAGGSGYLEVFWYEQI
jgi:hypothetical protein